MSIRRPAGILLALAVLALSAPGAKAQEAAARLTLLRQTPWSTPDEPLLELELRATNEGGAPLEQLSLWTTLWGPVRSRSAYADALRADPVPATAIDVRSFELDGMLEPGASVEAPIELHLDTLALDADESLIYPLKVELRSGLEPIAVLRTPVIFIVEEPRTPMQLTWSVVLHHPIEFGPDGVFRSTALEEALAEGGHVASALAGLERLVANDVPVDLVVSPLLVLQLERMAQGYAVTEGTATRTVVEGQGGAAAALRALQALRRIAASDSVELSALPFSVTPIPALIQSGLSRDVGTQLERGRFAVERLLLRAPDASVFQPPSSALDEQSVERLSDLGVAVLLLDPAAVPPEEQPLGFAPPATAAVAAGPSTVSVVVSDQGIQDRLVADVVSEDPLLAAQAALGELAAIWRELPGEERGVAMRVPELLPGPVYGPLLNRISGAPFLRPRAATDLVEAFPPPERPARVVSVPTSAFDPSYVERIRQGRRKISAYRSMLLDTSPLPPDRLETALLFAEAGQFIDEPAAGRALIGWVHDQISTEWSKLGISVAEMVTLTSSSGQIPLRVTNGAGYPVLVTVELVSYGLQSVADNGRRLKLEESSVPIVFDVRLRATGRFPVRILVRAPLGRSITETTITVRSTAYNRAALYVTLAAAAVLVLLWARRLLRRRTS